MKLTAEVISFKAEYDYGIYWSYHHRVVVNQKAYNV